MASRGRILPRRRIRASRARDSITRDRLNGVTYRIITDNQGSVRLVMNAETGEVAQRLDYDSLANPIASPKALAAVSEHFGTAELGRLLYDTNHYGSFGKLDRLLSAGQIATQRIQEVETPALLSRIGTMGTFTDATLNIIK